MSNFMIGMFGGFDRNKLERDFRKDFYGVEACMFQNMEEFEKLQSAIEGYELGIHFPLIKNSYICRDPLFLSNDVDEREGAYEIFEKEIKLAGSIRADYILVHFPKPVLLDKKLDWSCWRFGNDREWAWEDEYPYDVFVESFKNMFYKLAELSDKYNTKIILENDAFNKYLYQGSLLKNCLKEYSNIELCMDIARLHLFESIDSDFDSKKFVRDFASNTYLIHLSNTNIKSNKEGGHIPVSSDQKPEDGWADVEYYLKTIVESRPDAKILFEHRSDLLSDSQLERCYNWVNSICRR